MNITASPGKEYIIPKNVSNTAIYINGSGTKEAPFVIKGQSGMSQISGNSFIKIGNTSKNIVIKDLHFYNNNITFKNSTALIEVGKNKTSKISDILIDNIKITYNGIFKDLDMVSQFFWINMHAENVTVKNSVFENKQNRLPIIHIGAGFSGNRITHSIFKNVPARKGEALEAIRVGLANGSSDAVICNNTFSNYKGDSETISVKADGVSVIENTFYDGRSGVSIRYANNVKIENNTFDKNTDAVRISGENHRIINNKFLSNNKSDIVFMGGGKNYPPVNNILIKNNTFQDRMKISYIENGENTLLPQNVSIEDNYNLTGKKIASPPKGLFNNKRQVSNKYNIKNYIIEY